MSMETYANTQILRHAVSTAITCKFTGEVLDVRRAVNVEVRKDNRTIVDNTMTGDHWDTVKDQVLKLREQGFEVTVLDGRELFAKPRPRC